MIMTSDPTRVGLKPTELILIPVQELTSDPTRVGLKLSGEITDWNRSVSSDPTRVGLKPCLKWRFQPLYQGVIG